MNLRNGVGQRSALSTKAIRLGLTLSAMLLLAGCATTPSDGTARESIAAGYVLIEQTATVARALHGQPRYAP